MDLIFKCPHCFTDLIINKNDLNCKIFRHALYKNFNRPFDPHASKEVCKRALEEGIIYGCAGPFRIIEIIENNVLTYKIEICDYV